MTPKQKAIELIERIESVSMQSDQYNKSCAMIIVDEVLKVIPENKKVTRAWWRWVKNEVEKLYAY